MESGRGLATGKPRCISTETGAIVNSPPVGNMRGDAGTAGAVGFQPGSSSSWRSITAALTGPLALFGLDVFAPLSLTWYEAVRAEVQLARSPGVGCFDRPSFSHRNTRPASGLALSVAALRTGACWRTSCPLHRSAVLDSDSDGRLCRRLGERLTGPKHARDHQIVAGVTSGSSRVLV